MNAETLPAQTRTLYLALDGQGDVHVVHLYERLTDKRTNDHVLAQRYLSPYVTRLNDHLAEHGEKVEPGSLRATYRLIKAA